MGTLIIEILLVSIVSFLVLSIIKLVVNKYKIRINNYVYLAIGIIFTLIPAVLQSEPGSVLYLASTPLGLAFILAFLEFKGWFRNNNNNRSREEKKVIRPKAKPNRVKQLNKEKNK
ncbi:MAG: hypothetical protein AB6733_04065 [Clostridiaceae bacterium]